MPVQARPPSPSQVKASLEVALAEIKKRGRPKIHPDRAAYKAQKERERRARKRAEKAK